jgi:integrase
MGSVYPRGNSWIGQYNDRGRTIQKTLGKRGVITKTLAREMLRKIEQRVKLGEYDMLNAEIPTFNDFANEYLMHGKEVIQKRSWWRDVYGLKHFISLFGDRRLSEITPKDVDDYKKIRLKDVAPSTVNRELQCARSLFNLAKRWKKFFGDNPVSTAKLIPVNNQKERILARKEEERLLELSNPYLKPILITALNTGMRKNEILTLMWTNIDQDTRVITLEHTNTKTKTTRRIPINSVLRKLLLEQRLKSGGHEFIFLSPTGEPYKRHDSIKGSYERLCKNAGITGLRFHDLRHTAATRMIEGGASIVAVSKILGHSDIKMTMRYTHPDISLKEAVELLTKPTISESVTDIFTDNEERI